MQPLEAWIRKHVALERVNSARLRYDGIDHQAPRGLAGVYRPYDPDEIYDWVDLTLIFAYLDALATAGRVLDAGTGDGWPALGLAPYVREVVGIDLSRRRVAVAEENRSRLGYSNVTFSVADAGDLPFPDRSFDGAVAGCALEQADDLEKALAEIRRVLVPGGGFVATVEHLAAELPTGKEEEVEFFPEDDAFVYRYLVKEASPAREAEYRLTLHPNGENGVFLHERAASFPRRPGFVRRDGEPGARPLAGEIAERYGIPFLLEAAAAIVAGEYFVLRHVDLFSLAGSLRGAGFIDVAICGRITRLAHRFFLDLHEEGLLRGPLRPHFNEICRAFAKLWPFVPPQDDPVLFIRSRRGP